MLEHFDAALEPGHRVSVRLLNPSSQRQDMDLDVKCPAVFCQLLCIYQDVYCTEIGAVAALLGCHPELDPVMRS